MRSPAPKPAEKRKPACAQPRRPAGIQNIGPKLYADMARVIRSLPVAAERQA